MIALRKKLFNNSPIVEVLAIEILKENILLNFKEPAFWLLVLIVIKHEKLKFIESLDSTGGDSYSLLSS